MTDELTEFPEFERPPVVEAVVGVQFVPLIEFTNAHAGWFWRECLGEGWPKVTDALPLPEQFERFGEHQAWGPAQLGLMQLGPMLSPAKPPDRLQIANDHDDRLIQIQNNRFHCNWRKRSREYPKHRQARTEFGHFFGLFRDFVSKAKLGTLVPNQWEVIYVNHIPRGELWQAPRDWHRVLPGLLCEPATAPGARFEGLAGQWNYEIEPARGRVYLSVQHIKTAGEAGIEALAFQLTARGEVSDKPGWTLDDGLDRGHDEIRRLFIGLTSSDAHRVWGRRC